jgi:predicted nucleotidyltransferase
MFEKIRKKLTSFFKKEKGILFAYLFGSAVRGRLISESDIDIAVYLDKKRVKDTFKKRLKLMVEFERILKRETDVVILNDVKSVFFKFVIIKEGKLLFERNRQKRIEFELEVMRDYYDFSPFMEKYDKVYLERELSKK